MKAQLPVWTSTYAHDRRAHRHRCCCCSRIINAGDVVVMFRSMGFRGVKAMHSVCSAQRFGGVDSNYTFTEMAVFRAIEYSVSGLSFSAKSVFKACESNEIAATINISRERLFAFGLHIDEWPEAAVLETNHE